MSINQNKKVPKGYDITHLSYYLLRWRRLVTVLCIKCLPQHLNSCGHRCVIITQLWWLSNQTRDGETEEKNWSCEKILRCRRGIRMTESVKYGNPNSMFQSFLERPANSEARFFSFTYFPYLNEESGYRSCITLDYEPGRG